MQLDQFATTVELGMSEDRLCGLLKTSGHRQTLRREEAFMLVHEDRRTHARTHLGAPSSQSSVP